MGNWEVCNQNMLQDNSVQAEVKVNQKQTMLFEFSVAFLNYEWFGQNTEFKELDIF